VIVRDATSPDAPAIASVLRRSIEQLCCDDHQGRAERLEPWLRNKTDAVVETWIVAPDTRIVVADAAAAILGVGGASDKGEILLNYVATDARFRGVSKAVLTALETWLRSSGIEVCRLDSTATARRFYLDRGYQEVDRSAWHGGMIAHHMFKKL
jgi:GNAT superfamily N-acetyltransferase